MLNMNLAAGDAVDDQTLGVDEAVSRPTTCLGCNRQRIVAARWNDKPSTTKKRWL